MANIEIKSATVISRTENYVTVELEYFKKNIWGRKKLYTETFINYKGSSFWDFLEYPGRSVIFELHPTINSILTYHSELDEQYT